LPFAGGSLAWVPLPKHITMIKHQLIITLILLLISLRLHLNAIAGRAGGEPGVGAHWDQRALFMHMHIIIKQSNRTL
jgi:hypothetical protein